MINRDQSLKFLGFLNEAQTDLAKASTALAGGIPKDAQSALDLANSLLSQYIQAKTAQGLK